MLGATGVGSLAGCLQARDGENTEVTLPGDPTDAMGELPVQRTTTTYETDSSGFDGSESTDTFQPNIELNGDTLEIEFSPTHGGTGKASGSATGAFQTAWKSPRTDEYRITGSLFRSGVVSYSVPDRGEVMASFDVNLYPVDYDHQDVIRRGEKNQLRAATEPQSNELAEFVVSTGVSALAGKALGIGLIGRTVLGQIVNELVDVESSPADPGTEVTETVHRDPTYPLNFSAHLHVPEGTVVVYEVAPTINWSYEIEDSTMNPTFEATCEFDRFVVEPMDAVDTEY